MTASDETFILHGRTLAFIGDPFHTDPVASARIDPDGAVLVADGAIAAVGSASRILQAHPRVPVRHRPDAVIMAGFVDCHAHYPQYGMIASYGEALLEWLQRYTFPTELGFADPALCRATAARYLDECLANGTTAACVYATVHAQSVDALFEAALARGMHVASGKVMMDRNAPAGLTDTAQSGYDESAALIARWHGRGRLGYVVTPRFAVTSTRAQLDAAGALWRAHAGTLVQTHVSENPAEIASVAEFFPDARDYVDVYAGSGLIGPGTNLGHAIHLTDRERAAIAATGAGISHCPTSNLFLGSGLMDLHGLRAAGIPVGLATDIGAGTSLSMLATMRAAYEIARLRGASLHPAQAYWLATIGSAQVMRCADRIGNLAPGLAADIVVLDPAATPLLADRIARAQDDWDVLFALMILGDERCVLETYVAGRLAHARVG